MTNPYKAPSSNVETNNKLFDSKRKWKIFFVIILILEILSIISMFIDETVSWKEIATEFIVYTSIIIGLFGFSFDKKIFYKNFWVLLIPIGIIWDIYSVTQINWGDIGTGLQAYFIIGITIVVVIPLFFLTYYGLYKYSYNSPQIWNEKRVTH